MKRSLIVLGLLGLGPSAFGLPPAQPGDSERIQRLRAWVNAALQHVSGEADVPVFLVRQSHAAELAEVRNHVYSLIRLIYVPTASTFRTPADQRLVYTRPELAALRAIAQQVADRGEPNQLLRRGAMLHTDIAHLAPPDLTVEESRSTPAMQQRTVLMSDGRTLARGDTAGHWEMARSLLDSIASDARGEKPEPAADPFVSLWYRAVGRFMLLENKLWLPHFDRALQLFPRDPELLLLAGALHETLAAPRIQDALRANDAVSVGYDAKGRAFSFDTGVRSQGAELGRAEDYLRRAVGVDGGLVEARMHLGRVLTLRDRAHDAVKELSTALAAAGTPLLRYFTSLFLGAAAEAAGDVALARQSYEQAADLYPRAQSPLLALSQIAQTSGGRSSRSLNEVLTMSPGEREREDPWWTYHSSVGRDAVATFDRLHAMLRAGDRR